MAQRESVSATPPMLGIFVGGASRRMGGQPKGLLRARDTQEPLVVRLARLGREAGLSPVWVGNAESYRALVPGLPELVDRPAGIGPLGGLSALLSAADTAPVIAVACDMPHVSSALLQRLSSEQPGVSVLAPRSASGIWEPLCARYDPTRVLPICDEAIRQGERSFQRLFARLSATDLPLSAEEWAELTDWDRPEDLPR
jgi:molybdopterin-guanine dinucleotide biosynthesis protein A